MPFKPIATNKKGISSAAPDIEKKKLQKELITLEEERVYREGTVAIRDLVAPSALSVQSNFVQLGTTFLRTIFVITYPRYMSVGWSSPILNLNLTMDLAMFFYPVNSAVILKQLKKKVGALEAQLSADAEKGAARDPLRETALRDIEQLRDNLTQGIEHFFQFAFYATIYTESKEKLEQLSEDIENIFGSKLINSRKVLFQAEQGFNSTLPLCNDELSIAFNMNSSPIAAID